MLQVKSSTPSFGVFTLHLSTHIHCIITPNNTSCSSRIESPCFLIHHMESASDWVKPHAITAPLIPQLPHTALTSAPPFHLWLIFSASQPTSLKHYNTSSTFCLKFITWSSRNKLESTPNLILIHTLPFQSATSFTHILPLHLIS